MTTSASPTTFLRALEGARELGRADGRLAVEVEPDGEPGPVGSCCHGLDSDGLARLVWGDRAGSPPAGVRLDAPHWYAQGFAEALADARAERCRRPRSHDAPEIRSGAAQR